jgi:predicted ATP-dependent protease
VLPIGGLKEKSLAAFRAGMKTIVIPDRNEKDLDEIPKVLRRKLTWVIAENMSDVLKVSLMGRGNSTDKRRMFSAKARLQPRNKRSSKRGNGPLQKARRENPVPLRP